MAELEVLVDSPRDPSSEKFRRRFWKRVNIGWGDDCWTWKPPLNPYGYGEIRKATGQWPSRDYRAHRVAFIFEYGGIPDGLKVLHRCDNPACVRPEHLYLGTQRDNVADMWNRTRRGGEEFRNAKLTNAIVQEARQRHQAGGVSLRSLARQYGVAPETMRDALRGRTWKRVNFPRKYQSAILTAAQVDEIRERYARGDGSGPALAREYNVSFRVIHSILTYQSKTQESA